MGSRAPRASALRSVTRLKLRDGGMRHITSSNLALRLDVRLRRAPTRPAVQIRAAVPVFRVENVARSLTWYRDVLGFQASPFPAAPPYDFAILTQGEAELMLRRADAASRRRAKHDGCDAYFRLAGHRICELYDRLRGHATVRRELHRAPNGEMEFDLEDCDGYVLTFTETV